MILKRKPPKDATLVSILSSVHTRNLRVCRKQQQQKNLRKELIFRRSRDESSIKSSADFWAVLLRTLFDGYLLAQQKKKT